VRLGLRVSAYGKVMLRAQLETGTNLFADVDTGMAFTAGVGYELRAQMHGSTIRMKAWKSGTTEPSSWRIIHSTTAAPQTAGVFGLRTVNYSSSTVTVRVDDFTASSIATATVASLRKTRVASKQRTATAKRRTAVRVQGKRA
jgi:hypothetical protein